MKHAKKHHESTHAEQHQKACHISVCTDGLALPEIHTGHVERQDKLECDTCPIYYHCVAVPEVHFRDALQCPAQTTIEQANP